MVNQASTGGDNRMEAATKQNAGGTGTGTGTAFKLADLTAKAVEGKMLAEDLVEIGKRKAQRVVRRGYATAEDYLEDSTHYIKHNPLRSVGIALGVGLALGFVSGLLTRRG
jgi:ElaB/YqjD/DUF883 family membrane-anchored ribosome-binding protein